jgi:hypothetical protein
MLLVVVTCAAWADGFDPNKKIDRSQMGNPGDYAAANVPAGWQDLGPTPQRGELLHCVSHVIDKDHATQARINIHVAPNTMGVTPDNIKNPEGFFPAAKMQQFEKDHFVATHFTLGGNNPGLRVDLETKEGRHNVQAFVLLTDSNRLLVFSGSAPIPEWPKYQAAIEGCLNNIEVKAKRQ